MELTLRRTALRRDYTIGHLYIDGKYRCDTLEDAVRDLDTEAKVPGRTAIPAGRYRVIVNRSPKFGRLLPRLLDVPHFDGILIHAGNSAADTAGCILVGRNTAVGRLTDSRAAETALTDLLRRHTAAGHHVYITIEQ